MTQIIEATYEKGVLVPRQPLALAEHEKVRLTVESVFSPNPRALETLRYRRQNRLTIDPALADEIACSHEFDLLDLP